MARKEIRVMVTTRLIIEVEEDADVDEILSNMDYNFDISESDMSVAKMVDTDIEDWEVSERNQDGSWSE